jgi:PAS domain S-box-containing protein
MERFIVDLLQSGALLMLKNFGLFKSRAAQVLNALDKSLAIIEFDARGKILSANNSFCQVMGYAASEIIGKHHSLFVDAEYARSDAYKNFWLKLSRGEFDQQEYRRVAKGGKRVWIQASYNPIVNSSGKVVRVVKVASDTTAAHERNAAFEAKLAAISRVQGVVEFTSAGEITHANGNFLNLVGYRLEEIKGRHHRMFVDDAYANSAEYRDFWKKLNKGEFVAAEFRRFGKGGHEIWIQASYNPIFDANNKVTSIVKFATDISGRVRAVMGVRSAPMQRARSLHLALRGSPKNMASWRLRAGHCPSGAGSGSSRTIPALLLHYQILSSCATATGVSKSCRSTPGESLSSKPFGSLRHGRLPGEAERSCGSLMQVRLRGTNSEIERAEGRLMLG